MKIESLNRILQCLLRQTQAGAMTWSLTPTGRSGFFDPFMLAVTHAPTQPESTTINLCRSIELSTPAMTDRAAGSITIDDFSSEAGYALQTTVAEILQHVTQIERDAERNRRENATKNLTLAIIEHSTALGLEIPEYGL